MNFGSMPRDGGNLILSETDLTDLKNTDPQAERFVKSYCGAKDFIEGNQRYCLWITDSQAQEAQESAWISGRLRSVSEYRQTSDAPSTAKYAKQATFYLYSALTAYRFDHRSTRFFRTTRLYPHRLLRSRNGDFRRCKCYLRC